MTAQQRVDVGAEDARLQPVGGVVGPGDRLVERAVRRDGHERGEHFLAIDLHFRRGVQQHRGRDELPAAGAARRDLGAVLDRFRDPAFHALGGVERNQRPHLGLVVEHVTDVEGAHRGKEQIEERLQHPFVNEDPLGGDAGLARVGEPPESAARRGPGEIGVGLHDDRGVAAELERDAFGAGFGADRPAGLGAAGEADHPHARVFDEDLGHFDMARHDVHGAGGISRAADDLGEAQRRERILRRWLQGDGRPARHRRRDFVGGEQHREVERRNPGDRRQREPPRDREASCPDWVGVGGQHLAADACRLLRRVAEYEDGAVQLDARLGDRLAGLERQRARQLSATCLQAVGDLAQGGRALEGGEGAARRGGGEVGVEGRPHLGGTSELHDTDFAAVVRRPNHRALARAARRSLCGHSPNTSTTA